MPPGPSVAGANAIGAFLAASLLGGGRRMRLVPTLANGRPAFASYMGPGSDVPVQAFAILVLEIAGERIARIDAFAEPHLFARFGLPQQLPA